MNINAPITKTVGREHYTEVKGQKLFLWEKLRTGAPAAGTILFVHGSSMASTPGFDLQAPGYVSGMGWVAAQGFRHLVLPSSRLRAVLQGAGNPGHDCGRRRRSRRRKPLHHGAKRRRS